jgi:hypothetical protein
VSVAVLDFPLADLAAGLVAAHARHFNVGLQVCQ